MLIPDHDRFGDLPPAIVQRLSDAFKKDGLPDPFTFRRGKYTVSSFFPIFLSSCDKVYGRRDGRKGKQKGETIRQSILTIGPKTTTM